MLSDKPDSQMRKYAFTAKAEIIGFHVASKTGQFTENTDPARATKFAKVVFDLLRLAHI